MVRVVLVVVLSGFLLGCSKQLTQERYVIGEWATLKRNDSLIKIDYYPVILQNKDSLFVKGSVTVYNPKTYLIINLKKENKVFVQIEKIILK